MKTGRTRRAKMYYLREKTAKEIRKKTRAETLSAQAKEKAQEASEAPAEEAKAE